MISLNTEFEFLWCAADGDSKLVVNVESLSLHLKWKEREAK